MCAPYFVNLNNNTFRLFDIVTLGVAIISNVQNVRLQRRHMPADDASTRRRRGSQQAGPVRTTRRSDARAAGRRPRNK